jgi:hypothetical protein
MNEELKKKLFGFSQEHYVTNNCDPRKLIIENHPMKGRIIMTKDKYES